MDSISRSGASHHGRRLSNSLASTSGREATRRRGRTRLQVDAALFEPPPFQPAKLSVQYLPGAAVTSSARLSPPSSSSSSPLPRFRRYTLTHNDITGALQLSIGAEYNQQQVQGFYTRILRDEITAEWLFGGTSSSTAPPELHIYCHVSGEERWLAPPQLRNFIFRREMTLVLDTFLYADRQLLQAFPDLLRAKVYVHFQSDVQDLDLREYWGVLGQRASWRRMPKGVLARLKLLLFGFPALPHQRPRHALTHQQALQQGKQQGGMAPAAAVAAAAAATAAPAGGVAAVTAAAAAAAGPAIAAAGGGISSSGGGSTGHHQWHAQAELAVEERPVALSLHDQRQRQQGPSSPTQHDQQQQQQLPGVMAEHEPCSCCSSAEVGSQGAYGVPRPTCEQQQAQPQQQECLHPEHCTCEVAAASNGDGGSAAASSNVGSSSSAPSTCQLEGAGLDGNAGRQQQQWPLPSQQQLQEQLGVVEQAVMAEALLEYGRWSAQQQQQQQQQAASVDRGRQLLQVAASANRSTDSSSSSSSSSSGLGGGNGGVGGGPDSGSSVLPAAMLGAPSALQLVLQQQQEQMLLKTAGSCAAVVMATANAVVDASSSTAGRCQ